MISSPSQFTPYEYRGDVYKAYSPPKIDSVPITPDQGINATQGVCLLIIGGSAVMLAKTVHDMFTKRG